MRMEEVVAADMPGKRVLTVIHRSTLDRALQAAPPDAAAWAARAQAEKRMYVVPKGSNDDWYFLYAAFVARGDGLLVTNDQLRDHVWAMLRPKHVLKWRERHIARYSIPMSPPAAR
ncbi:hypothetical protein MNEG_13854 [Monoraphidium neglectum]|uniref:PRORP domain-containing protein n=1 Tax=Monoraphidium neglectum TaxID=145388 RepID=A0A0D2LQZ8_9CHLO|nr:hypothetical protein MNEG_13854 [Monoraphidium neglectum]KIY94109.1 hypothetical protein MNEG_13854 [Monoraphidium neglectum]|eukprot:XP_013893129.1 hypothetical protein MNEG_13854 [Monoraphidium neglectum]